MQDKPLPNVARVSAKGLKVPARAPDQSTAIASQPKELIQRKSAAALTVPQRKPTVVSAPTPCEVPRNEGERRALFDSLRRLRDDIKPSSSQPELAIALIEACVAGGICTKREIISALIHLGLNNRFAGAMVDNGTKEGRWRKGADDRYHLLD